MVEHLNTKNIKYLQSLFIVVLMSYFKTEQHKTTVNTDYLTQIVRVKNSKAAEQFWCQGLL